MILATALAFNDNHTFLEYALLPSAFSLHSFLLEVIQYKGWQFQSFPVYQHMQ